MGSAPFPARWRILIGRFASAKISLLRRNKSVSGELYIAIKFGDRVHVVVGRNSAAVLAGLLRRRGPDVPERHPPLTGPQSTVTTSFPIAFRSRKAAIASPARSSG